MEADIDIVCTTYNHEKSIAQTLKSLVNQKTKYTFRIILCDDCSNDQTSEISQGFLKSYPNKILYIRHNKNIGLMSNYLLALKKCKSRYIAYCDGDDFWTDPYKLEKQVTYMETHPEVILTHHKDTLLDERGIDYKVYADVIHNPNLFQIFDTHFISSPSIVCRHFFTENHFSLMKYAGSGDIAIFALAAINGRIDYIDETMACYRLSPGAQTGLFYSNLHREICNINYVMLLNNVYGCRFDNQLLQKLVLVLKKHSHALSRLSVYQRFKIKVKNAILLYGNIPTSPLRRAQLLFNYIIN